MRISTKVRYGLRLMFDLTLHREQKSVSLREIARRQAISPKYLWQVLAPLKAAGFISSIRGPRGGYRLNRAPARISLLDIVTALEGPPDLVRCIEEPAACPRSTSCTAREVWKEIQEKFTASLGAVTLEDLAERHEKKRSDATPSYTI